MIKRQLNILNFLKSSKGLSRKGIEDYLNLTDDVSKVTVIRDLDYLKSQGYIVQKGRAKNIKYYICENNDIFINYDVNKYFAEETDERTIKYPNFNFDIFDKMSKIFSEQELENLKDINKEYIKKVNNLSKTLLKKEFERLLIELSWKSSKIEGNTYSLLDTETLIKENTEAEGHKKEEAIMILNHKKALEYIFESKDYYKDISLKKIEELHEILTSQMGVNRGLRKSPVGIVGTNYRPLFNEHQIKEAMEKLTDLINNTQSIIEKALIAVLMISYIQPFEDGNKRTGRILANAILYSNNYCPISYRSVKESEYKKAVILFYENNSLMYFKKIFVEQFEFAVKKYF